MRDYGQCKAHVKEIRCERRATVKRLSLCNAHYLQQKNPEFKEFKSPRPYSPGEPCIASGCSRVKIARNLCTKHYQQKYSIGEVYPEGYPVRARKVLRRDSNGRKRCPRCETWKDEGDFYGGRATQDTLSSTCKQCHSERMISYTYNLSMEELQGLLLAQGSSCGVCDTPLVSGKYVVDHDHDCCPGSKTCGRCIRGILCSPCNLQLGVMGDTKDKIMENVERFLRYLDKGDINRND